MGTLRRFGSRTFAAALAATLVWLAVPAPGMATVYLHRLGTSPLLGRVDSASELRAAMHAHEGRFRTAAALIGLDAADTATLVRAVDAGHVRWVTVPRHLERSTWAGSGAAHVLYDVVIPADTKGYLVSIRHGRDVSELYIPAACGNLSIVHRRLPPPEPKPVPTPVPVPTQAPTPEPTATPLPPVKPPPLATLVTPHHANFSPLAIFIPLLFGGNNPSPPRVMPTCDP